MKLQYIFARVVRATDYKFLRNHNDTSQGYIGGQTVRLLRGTHNGICRASFMAN